jgi:hypothetical protein
MGNDPLSRRDGCGINLLRQLAERLANTQPTLVGDSYFY